MIPKRVLVTILLLATSWGCGRADVSESYAHLDDRESAHHALAATATPADMRAEAVTYGSDMTALMDDMRSQCAGMMGQSAGDLTGPMRTLVNDHCARLANLEDPDAVRAECDQHHERMRAALDTMRQRVQDAGLLGR